MNRSAMINNQGYTTNTGMAQEIMGKPAFRAIAMQAEDERDKQAMRYNYTYQVTGSVAGQGTAAFSIVIEQGTDFRCKWILGSAYSYDAANATDFPLPNSVGATAWASRGLSVRITDSRSGRELTSGFIPFETLFSPGYGTNFQAPMPWNYYLYRNTILRFDVRNADDSARTHSFAIILNGNKVLTPEG